MVVLDIFDTFILLLNYVNFSNYLKSNRNPIHPPLGLASSLR